MTDTKKPAAEDDLFSFKRRKDGPHSSITVGAANGVFMAMGPTFAPISPVNGFAQDIGQRIRPET